MVPALLIGSNGRFNFESTGMQVKSSIFTAHRDYMIQWICWIFSKTANTSIFNYSGQWVKKAHWTYYFDRRTIYGKYYKRLDFFIAHMESVWRISFEEALKQR